MEPLHDGTRRYYDVVVSGPQLQRKTRQNIRRTTMSKYGQTTYENIGRIVKEKAKNENEKRELCEGFAEIFAPDNPRFNIQKFRTSCGIKTGEQQ